MKPPLSINRATTKKQSTKTGERLDCVLSDFKTVSEEETKRWSVTFFPKDDCPNGHESVFTIFSHSPACKASLQRQLQSDHAPIPPGNNHN